MNEAKGIESLLLEVLGTSFLAYVLNASEQEVIDRFSTAKKLNDQQEEALAQLLQFIQTTGLQLDNSSPLWHLNLDVFASQANGTTMSCANVLRTIAGGSIAAPTSKDKILEILYIFAADFYSLFLIPKDRKTPDPFQPTLSAVAFRHHRQDELQKAMLADKALVKLFGTADLAQDAINIQGFVARSNGTASGVQLVMLPETLLRNAWHLALLESKQPTIDELCQAIKKVLGTLRAAANNQDATIPVRVGFTGVVLPKGKSELILPWGKLRATSPLDDSLIPAAFDDNGTSTSTPDGQVVIIKYSGDVVLETEIPYKVFVTDWSKVAGSTTGVKLPQDLHTFEQIQKRIEAVEIGLLFATKREKDRPRTVFSWRAEIDPLGFGHSASWRNPQTLPMLIPAQLSENEAMEWGKWIKLVDEKRVPSIEVAIHRVLIAETERKDPGDVVIDAVIAWENLVGSSNGEPTLRVSAALAWLLGEDAVERKTLQDKFSKMYALRSRLVHGSGVLTPKEAAEKPQEAIGIALDALRKIFDERPELLSECKDSTERSKRLILGY